MSMDLHNKGAGFQRDFLAKVEEMIQRAISSISAPIAAQDDGVGVSNQHRALNFQGDGVSVSNDIAGRRVNVHIPGAPVASSTTTVNSAAAAGKMFQLGSEPSGWEQPGFNDTSWSASVAETSSMPFAPYSGSTWIAPVNASVGDFDTFLHRLSTTLPAGTISSATLQVHANDFARGVWVNGTLLYADTAPATGTPGENTQPPTMTISPSLLVAGSANVLAIKVQNDNVGGGHYGVNYQLVVTYTAAGADARYQLLSEKDQPDGYAGLDGDSLIDNAELADTGTPSSSTFLRGDHTWAAASTNAVTVTEVDASPAVTATTIEFPNGTVTDQGGGVARYTPASSTAPDYICVVDQKAAGTAGGTFTSGAWQTRVLNTEQSDTGGNCSLASNQMTLAAGTYEAWISGPAFKVGGHQIRLRNITDGTTVLVGSAEATGSGDDVETRSIIAGKFTIAASKALEVQHQCQTTRSTDGFGGTINFGEVVIFTVVVLHKVG